MRSGRKLTTHKFQLRNHESFWFLKVNSNPNLTVFAKLACGGAQRLPGVLLPLLILL